MREICSEVFQTTVYQWVRKWVRGVMGEGWQSTYLIQAERFTMLSDLYVY